MCVLAVLQCFHPKTVDQDLSDLPNTSHWPVPSPVDGGLLSCVLLWILVFCLGVISLYRGLQVYMFWYQQKIQCYIASIAPTSLSCWTKAHTFRVVSTRYILMICWYQLEIENYDETIQNYEFYPQIIFSWHCHLDQNFCPCGKYLVGVWEEYGAKPVFVNHVCPQAQSRFLYR